MHKNFKADGNFNSNQNLPTVLEDQENKCKLVCSALEAHSIHWKFILNSCTETYVCMLHVRVFPTS